MMLDEESLQHSEASLESFAEALGQLQDLGEHLRETLGRLQITLRLAGPDRTNTSAINDSDTMSQVLLLQRRLVADLKRRVEAQQSEHVHSGALQEIAATVNSSLELDQVLSQVMDIIVRLTRAERAMLLLMDENTQRLEVKVARNMDRETIEKADSFQISRSIVRQVAESGDPVVTMNAQEDDRFATESSIISYGLLSILCVPLKIRDVITGVIYADNRIASGIFSEQDRDLLAAFANQAAVAIENARLFREVRDNLAEITEMKDLMDNVFASVDGGVITIDDENRIRLMNRAASRILGLAAAEALNEDYRSVLTPIGLEVEDKLAQVTTSGASLSAEIDIIPAGSAGRLTLNVTLSPLCNIAGETLGVAMVLDDITEQKRVESIRRYLPGSLVDKVRDLDAAQRPQQRLLTVMYSDLRGYSTYSELRDPSWLIEVINGYFDRLVEAIDRYQGFTDKFMGDAVMALFNTPLNPQSDHVQRALQSAMMIQQSLTEYRRELPEERHLHFGIGIHTGAAVVGNVGSELRKDYSAIGDAVNLAKRLQEMAKADQILVSEAIAVQAGDGIKVQEVGPVRIKGRHALEQVYTLQQSTLEP